MSDSGQITREIRINPIVPTGFELGSGLFVSTVSPELAAESLRNADIDGD